MTEINKPLTQLWNPDMVPRYTEGAPDVLIADDVSRAAVGLRDNFYGGADWQELRKEDYEYVLKLIDKWLPIFAEKKESAE